MAVVRGKLEGIAVVLASATPSLESLHNVARRRYAHAVLPQRHGDAVLPAVSVIDMRKEKLPAQRFLSPALVTALAGTIASGEPAMLFRSEERRVGKGCVRTCRSRWSPYH